jgi:hypothetical protein|tara:strand:+ start:8084 stop:8245 length:162 start_codon:yes stop_codon:yes gene_type:complete
MKQFKYFNIKDSHKEQIGIVQSHSLDEAYIKASKIKNLNLEEFKKIFSIEEVK